MKRLLLFMLIAIASIGLGYRFAIPELLLVGLALFLGGVLYVVGKDTKGDLKGSRYGESSGQGD